MSDDSEMLSTIRKAVSSGDFKGATTRIQAGLDAKPARPVQAELLYMLAVVQRMQKDYVSALDTLQQLTEIRPDYGRAFQERGYCYVALGKEQKAAGAFFKATQHNPALLASWQQLIAIYEANNDPQARQLARQQVAFLEQLPKPLLGAYDLMQEKAYAQAEKVCRDYLVAHKHHVEAMLLLAEIGMKLHVYHEAEFLLESAVEIYPGHIRAGMAYLALLSKLGKYRQAESQARRLMQLEPENTAFIVSRANALMGLGELHEAVTLFTDLLGNNPHRPAVWLALGHAYKAGGKIEQAVAAYQKAASILPDFGDAYWSLANTKTYTFNEEEKAAMLANLGSSTLALEDRIHINFALGKALEDQGQYDEAFGYYAKGNALKLATTQFDISKTEQAIAAQADAFTQEVVSQFGGGCEDASPIFIVGLPRAGSTLLEQILASHPEVDGTMELHDILGIASKMNQRKTPYPFSVRELAGDQARMLGNQYIAQTAVYRQGAPYFTDKMPNNFIHIGLIKRILPNAKIIDARRDPFACCFSGFKQLFGDGQEFTYGLKEIGRYYKAYEALMAHWDAVFPGAILRVQHEDVLADLEGQVRRILDYCGLPFDERCISFYETQRVIKTPSAQQVRQPIYQSGAKQWEHFRSHLDPLFNALGRKPEDAI